MMRRCSAIEKQSCAASGPHRSNLHHLYWPKRHYKTPIEQAFRDLPENTVQLCVPIHNRLHIETEPPEKPDIHTMIRALHIPLEGVHYEAAA